MPETPQGGEQDHPPSIPAFPPDALTCETDYCIAMPHPGDPIHVDATGTPFRADDLAPVGPVPGQTDCPWPGCPWSEVHPYEADADAATAGHLRDEHDGRRPGDLDALDQAWREPQPGRPVDDDADGPWERMQDEGRWPSWM
ncbi:hypothetical protein [Micromonospora sp. WMMC273]|uniref:hypothetical protein n=1 Tax=Micromonospora sp. WMMC273 TaxID=3015157 RepID=UPI0022B5FDAE|nr:hypothetical protein [Micromonospora sp. WMMC273]MCZ7478841.1 hypothetical protein [Micromonospora sp. WMMC273]